MFEENYPKIRSEIEYVLTQENSVGFVDAPFSNWQRTGEGKWDMYGLSLYGNTIESNLNKFPVTFECLKSVRGLHSAGFVNLGKHSHLKAHAGREWKSVLSTEKQYLSDKNLSSIKEDKIPILRGHLTLINPRPDLTRLRIWNTPPDKVSKEIILQAEKDEYNNDYFDMTWHEGLIHIIDDTYLHEAKNESEHDRIILLFDFDKREYGYEPRSNS